MSSDQWCFGRVLFIQPTFFTVIGKRFEGSDLHDLHWSRVVVEGSIFSCISAEFLVLPFHICNLTKTVHVELIELFDVSLVHCPGLIDRVMWLSPLANILLLL